MSTIQIDQLRKTYGGIVAVDGMDLDVSSGSIHAIVGENGAGKSTLMKALAGAVRPDAGTISIDGEPIDLGSASAARQHGIGIVYQELSILPDRPLFANLFVDRQPTRFGLVDAGDGAGEAARACQARPRRRSCRPRGHGVDRRASVDRAGQSVARTTRVLILDEPNSALNDRETQRLFTILRELAAAGITVLYVSHRLEEVFSIADRVTVMRDGREILTGDTTSLTIPQVVEAMVGTKQESLYPSRHNTVDNDAAALVVPGCPSAAASSTSALTPVPARSSGWRESPALASSCCWGRCSASGAHRLERFAIRTARHCRRIRRKRSAEASAWFPPTAATKGLMLDRSVGSNIAQVAMARCDRPTRGCRDAPLTLWPAARSPASTSDGRAIGSRVVAVGRQPAEDRPGQVAGGVAVRRPPRRPDAGRRRRRQARDLRASCASSPTPGGSSCCARPSCPRSSASPIASSSSTGGG